MDYPVIICYAGGTAGDIVSLILDPSELSLQRQQLKKPHLFSNDQQKDIYLSTCPWLSIPSHDFAYHRQRNHQVLAVVCRYWHDAVWAAQRFKQLHRPQVWAEMTQHCGAEDIQAYAQIIIDFGNLLETYTSNVLYLDEITGGHAINRLCRLGYATPGIKLYAQWCMNNKREHTS